jgi:hypothetical protein
VDERLLEAHAVAVAAGRPGYLDPFTGLFVMTAQYLLDRDRCCDRGCRHCPYGPKPAVEADPSTTDKTLP